MLVITVPIGNCRNTGVNAGPYNHILVSIPLCDCVLTSVSLSHPSSRWRRYFKFTSLRRYSGRLRNLPLLMTLGCDLCCFDLLIAFLPSTGQSFLVPFLGLHRFPSSATDVLPLSRFCLLFVFYHYGSCLKLEKNYSTGKIMFWRRTEGVRRYQCISSTGLYSQGRCVLLEAT